VEVKSVEITSLSHDGRGVAHDEGKAVFVAGSLPGERVKLGPRRRHRNFDEAEIAAIETPSPHRVAAKCAHFGVCGGCALQHMAPAEQLVAKQGHLLEELRRTGKVEPQRLLPPLAAEPWNYRRRARLGAKWVVKKGRVVVGFRERLSPYVADLQRCEILAAPLGTLIDPLSQLIGSLSIKARVPQIEVAVGDNATALVFRVLDPPLPADLDRLRLFGKDRHLRIYVQRGGPDSLELLTGEVDPLLYRLPEFEVELAFEPTDFVQVNAALNRAMVSRAVELLAPQPGDRVLDLFCGLGNFSLPLARRAGEVVGVEGEAALVERARANAARNGLRNVEFHSADLAAPEQAGSWARLQYEAVLLDPPRAGAREVLPVLGSPRVTRVVYISCHTGSLARDAGLLVQEMGFRLTAAGVMDMFPHTAHVESLALFER
jgi:23S rRNA (uracil1939-C5)-methyltransferase